MNRWTYTLVFDKALPTETLLTSVRKVTEELLSRGCRFVRSEGTSAIRTFDHHGDERAFESALTAIPELAMTGGGMFSAFYDDDDLGLSFEMSPPVLRLSSGGRLYDTDVRFEGMLRSVFYWMCEHFRPIFGTSEDLDAVENIWFHCGVKSAEALLAEGEKERQDIYAGRLPDILPWLTYIDAAHFPEAKKRLAGIPGNAVEPIGSSGIMVRLADFPWELRFALRSDDGYELVDQFARRLIDGEKVQFYRPARSS